MQISVVVVQIVGKCHEIIIFIRQLVMAQFGIFLKNLRTITHATQMPFSQNLTSIVLIKVVICGKYKNLNKITKI